MGIEVLPGGVFNAPRSAFLATMIYNPATAVTYTASSTVMTAVDGTNLAVTFVVPASGSVFVDLSGIASSSADGLVTVWGLIDTVSGSVGQDQLIVQSAFQWRAHARFLLAGLVPGQTRTLRWAMRANSNTAVYLKAGGSADFAPMGPAIMTVEDAAVTTLGYQSGGVLNGSQAINTGAPGNVGLVVVGASGQAVSLQQWKDSAGAVRADVTQSGVFRSDGFAMVRTDDSRVAPTVWTSPTFLNGWIDYGTPFETCAYRKIGDIVYVRGFVKNGTITSGTPIVLLPAGFRPSADIHIPVADGASTAGARVKVTTAGNIETNLIGTSTWVTLANIQFSTV